MYRYRIYIYIHTYKMYMLSIGKTRGLREGSLVGFPFFTHTHLPPRYFWVGPLSAVLQVSLKSALSAAHRSQGGKRGPGPQPFPI